MDDKRIILWDLEVMHINWGADLGSLLCMGWKVLGEKKVHIESIARWHGRDILEDAPLVERCKHILETADMWVTYNGLRFDVPFLQTRLLINRLHPLEPIAHKDLYPTIKFRFKFSRNSLHSVQTALKLDESKTPVDLEKWLQAIAGRKAPLKEIEEHCYQDVLVLEEAYERVRPFMITHPRLHGYGVCNKCGGTLLKNKIYYTADKKPKITVKCQKCYGYETRTATVKELATLVP